MNQSNDVDWNDWKFFIGFDFLNVDGVVSLVSHHDVLKDIVKAPEYSESEKVRPDGNDFLS